MANLFGSFFNNQNIFGLQKPDIFKTTIPLTIEKQKTPQNITLQNQNLTTGIQQQQTKTEQQPKFQPITNWLDYRRIENMIIQRVRNSVREKYGVDISPELELKLRGGIFYNFVDYGIFRFTDQDTLNYIKFVENPKSLIPYFTTLERASKIRGIILTPPIQQALGLKATEAEKNTADVWEIIENLQETQEKLQELQK